MISSSLVRKEGLKELLRCNCIVDGKHLQQIKTTNIYQLTLTDHPSFNGMLAGGQKRMGWGWKKDWVEDLEEKQDGGCRWIYRQRSAGRIVLSISLAKGNLVDVDFRVVRRVSPWGSTRSRGQWVVHGLRVTFFNSPLKITNHIFPTCWIKLHTCDVTTPRDTKRSILMAWR